MSHTEYLLLQVFDDSIPNNVEPVDNLVRQVNTELKSGDGSMPKIETESNAWNDTESVIIPFTHSTSVHFPLKTVSKTIITRHTEFMTRNSFVSFVKSRKQN